MWCSLKSYYVFAVLSISISRVMCYIDDDSMRRFQEETMLVKGDKYYYDDISGVPEIVKNSTQRAVVSDYPDSNQSMDVINHNVEISMLKEKCPYYNNGRDVDLDEISDVWQMVYFHLAQDLPCFKIYLKEVSVWEKIENKKRYGSFSDRVNWTACDLEVQRIDKGETMRRHFLQRGIKGIMDNVVVLEHTVPWKQYEKQKGILESGKVNFTYTFHPESPDQWLVIENLLLMRDCFNGGVVVFSRASLQPRRGDVADALAAFGERGLERKMVCSKSN